jgi:hypothetical protein
MATDQFAELKKESYTIAATPDFVIRVIEYEEIDVPHPDDTSQTVSLFFCDTLLVS